MFGQIFSWLTKSDEGGSPLSSGWRPLLGWVGGFGCFVAYVVYPLFSLVHAWLNHKPLPEYPLETLLVILGQVLGFGGIRTYEKVKGVLPTAGVAEQTAPVPFLSKLEFVPKAEVVQPLPDDYKLANEVINETPKPSPEKPGTYRELSWGSKVSIEFRKAVLWIEEQCGLDADKLMNCIAFETGETFSPSVKNAAGSSGLGLIQFMRATHAAMIKKRPSLAKLAPTHEALSKLSAVQQLTFVYYYFLDFGKDLSGWSQEDVYMAILYPKAIGKPSSWVMPWKYGSLAYKQNAGLDLNRDKTITKAEAAAGVLKKALKGATLKG